jgi:putative ABC transport system permease protein
VSAELRDAFRSLTLWADVRLALRTLALKPGFALALVLTLGLGIGANTTIFTLVHAILLRPFPYPDPERLVRVHTTASRLHDTLREASVFDFQDWRRQNRSFDDLASYWSIDNTLSADRGGPAQSVRMTFATPELFAVLGIGPALGRVFTPAEDVIGGPVNQVVLSHALWESRFGRRPEVLGETIRLRGDTYTVVGVMPAGFRFPDRTDVWVPLMSRYASYPVPWWKDRNFRIHSVLGRLRAGVPIETAQAEMDTVAEGLARDFPTTNHDVAIRLVALRDAETGSIRPYLMMLVAAVALVLSIGCVNIANLLLVRAIAREGEMAVRTALGATRGRLIRQTLTETTVWALVAGVVGIALSYAGVRTVLALIPIELPFWMRVEVNGWVLAFSIVLSLVTGLIFGLAPALYGSKRTLAASLRDGVKGSVGTARARLRHAFVVAEIALSLVLAAGAALMLQSLLRLQDADLGFESRGVLSANAGHFLPNRSFREMIELHSNDFRRILDRLRALPGVSAVAASGDLPYYSRAENRALRPIVTPGQSDEERRSNLAVATTYVTPGYFATLGIPLLDGRDFTEADDWNAPYVAIVSQRLADTLWPGQSAIGRTIRGGHSVDDNPWHRVIGVAGNTRWTALDLHPSGEIYFTYRQWPIPRMHLLARTAGEPRQLTADLRQIVQDVNPENTIAYIQPFDAIIADALWQRRLWAYVIASFAGVALLLVSGGVYGVVSHGIGQRRREIGLRVALGANRAHVLWLVVRQGIMMALGGLALGLGAALAFARVLDGLLYGIAATDWPTLVAVSILLTTIALLACAIPAARSLRVDPAVTLRFE